MTTTNVMVPPNTDIADIYENSTDNDQEFVQNLALFLTTFLSAHLPVIENFPDAVQMLLNAHFYVVKISRVEDREVFKICLEYWTKLVEGLFEEASVNNQGRHQVYVPVLSQLRVVMIERMVKPEEVLVVENDEGEIVREFVKESDTIVLYKSMKQVLVYLTHLSVEDTETIMTEKLNRQVNPPSLIFY